MGDEPVTDEPDTSEPDHAADAEATTAASDAAAAATDAAVTDATSDATTDEVQDAEEQLTLVDVLVYAPVDALFSLLRDPRGSAVRGRARVEQALRQARALGELSVRFGQHELRRRTEAAQSAEETASADAEVAERRRAAGPAPDDVIADYDALSASQIVPMLQGLSEEERGRVAVYEQRARGRQTILRKIAQLDGTGE